ncbi:MAG TPA: lamin tail domain-containing protein, partial [Pyrinomonadaceae bacterium]|nr:lamin tail domain-containing protein [Pyrinomonadaceae bacterium]
MGSKLHFSAAVLTVLFCGFFLVSVKAQTQILPGQVTISELRLAGEGGIEDEFIEIYNNTNNDIFVQATDTTPGWAVAFSNGQIAGPLFVIPNGTRIPARGHFLGANGNGYSLAGYPSGNPTATNAKVVNGTQSPFANTTPNATWDFDVPNDLTVGIALFSTTNGPSFSSSTRLDAFGFVNAPALYREGTGYPTAALTRTLVRDMRTPAGTSKDTDNNAADFLLLT